MPLFMRYAVLVGLDPLAAALHPAVLRPSICAVACQQSMRPSCC